jgi:DUF971 family protein
MSDSPTSAPSPIDIRREGESIVIQWDNGTQDHWTPFQLRSECPCATCREKRSGEEEKKIAQGEKKRPMLPVLSAAEAQPLRIVSMRPVGNYGYNVSFSDGHHSGIFTFDRLARCLTKNSSDL